MLLCRSRGRPVSAGSGYTKSSGTYIRRQSTLAEVQSQEDPVEEEMPTKPRPRLLYADASMEKTKDSKTKLELRLVRDQDEEYSMPGSRGQTEVHRTIVHQIAVPEVQNRFRAVRAEYGVAKGKIIDRAVELQMRQGGSNIEWSHLLNRLEKLTPVTLPNQSTLTLCGPELELVEFYYMLLSDPTYKVVLDYPLISDGYGTMLIGGAEPQIKDVATLVNDDKEWQRLGIDKQKDSDDIPEARSVQGVGDPKPSLPLDQLRTPTGWTKRGLAEYIRAVTTSRAPQVLHRNVPHKNVVEGILVELLYNSPNLRSVLSWSALHQALSFLVKNQKTDAAKDLLGHMERNGFTPSVETFNILLRKCAQDQNMRAFNHFLNLMVGDGIVPNEATWVALMVGAPNVSSQKAIAKEMFNKGFAVRAAFARANAPQIVPYSFGPFLDAGGISIRYLKTLDDLYGPHWLHASAVDELIATLAIRSRFVEAIELLDHFSLQRAYNPSSQNIHVLLRHCARHNNADLAIWLVVYCHQAWRTNTMNHIILELLFDIAWKSRMFNTLRVIWKYTNAMGEATYDMRRLIHISLWQRMKPSPGTVQGRWKDSAASVVCGADPLAKGSLTPEEILEAEKRLYGRKPVFPFSLKLVEALSMDKEWSADVVKKTRGITWKVRNAIRVPFRQVVPVVRRLIGDHRDHGRLRRFMKDPKSGRLMRTELAVRKREVESVMPGQEDIKS